MIEDGLTKRLGIQFQLLYLKTHVDFAETWLPMNAPAAVDLPGLKSSFSWIESFTILMSTLFPFCMNFISLVTSKKGLDELCYMLYADLEPVSSKCSQCCIKADFQLRIAHVGRY